MSRPTASPIRKQKFGRRVRVLIALAILIGLIAADQNGWLLVRRSDDLAAYHGLRAGVVRVIDGDTIEVDLPDALHERPATRIRLWGIDCPEPARGGQPAEPWAQQTADQVESLAGDQRIMLWLESHQTRDSFGAVLAHVELPDGRILNEAILEAGLARADDRWPHTRLVRYDQIEFTARRQRCGIWSGE